MKKEELAKRVVTAFLENNIDDVLEEAEFIHHDETGTHLSPTQEVDLRKEIWKIILDI